MTSELPPGQPVKPCHHEPSVILGRGSGDSIERQFRDGESYAEKHDPPLQIIALLTEEESGYASIRPVLSEALRMIEVGEAKHLIVPRHDRLTRKGPEAFLNILNRIYDAKGKLHILDTPGGAQEITPGVAALLAGILCDESPALTEGAASD